MVNVASYYLDLLMVKFFNIIQSLYMEVLIPTSWALWQRLLIAGNCALIFFSTIFHQIQKCIHQLMTYLRYQPGKALLKGVHWIYYGLVIVYQQNAYKVILRAIQYQLLFILAMTCLDWICEMGSQGIKRGLQFLKQEELQNMDSSSATGNTEVCTSVFLVSEVPLRQHFHQINLSTLHKVSNFSFRSIYTNIKEGIGYCCFGTSLRQSTRIQGKDKEKGELSPSSDDIIHQIKSTLVTFFLFYIYNTFLFVQLIK